MKKQNGFALIIVFVLMSTVLGIAALALYQTSLCRSLARLQYIHCQQQYALAGLRSYALDFTRRRWRTLIDSTVQTSREIPAWCTINNAVYTARMAWTKLAPDRLQIDVALYREGTIFQTNVIMQKSDKTSIALLPCTLL